MKIQKYKKDFSYSYTLGAFPTIELIKFKKDQIINVYIHSSFSNKEIRRSIFDLLKGEENKIIENDDKIFSKLSDKENVYVIGIFKKYKMKLDKSSHHLLLDNPANTGNLGTIIRSSLGFNIRNIAIIKPSVDIFDIKTIRASMGSIFSVNIALFDSLEEYKKEYSNHKIYSFMLQTSNLLQDFRFDKNTYSTLAFGNEAHGLDDKYLKETPIKIEHSTKIDSLNITNAATIALYEFNKQIGNK